MTTVPQSVNAHGGTSVRANGGNGTQAIYSLIRDGKYQVAVDILDQELQNHPNSRAALSLMGYCYYYLQDFGNAAQIYERLCQICPGVQEYRVYWAQAMFKNGQYAEAIKASHQIKDPEYAMRMLRLQSAASYEQDDLVATKKLVDRCFQHDPETVVAHGCIAYKEAKYELAIEKFTDATGSLGYQADLAYNIALCHYKLKQYGLALKFIAEIIERGVRDHPELSVGSNADGIQVRSVGNSQTLKETALIEAFNLKAAIEYQLQNIVGAREALADMPPRSENELDPVTLHNTALMKMDVDPNAGFKKLNYLLSRPPFPAETFGNLLLLYVKYQYYDLAADVLAENKKLHDTHLGKELYDFLEAVILTQSSPMEAYQKFDELGSIHIDALRRLTKEIQDGRINCNNEAIKNALKKFDAALERYIPVLMAQAKIYWDQKDYNAVEKKFRESAEFCSEHDVWKLNIAHVFFMQETKYDEAIRHYELALKKKHNILDVTAIVLANLCVSYIMTNRNEDAEELMRQIEKEEEQSYQDQKQHYHLCIVNLVIGTLYCSKRNFPFGISRIIKSLEPYSKKLNADTWYYAKRCFLGLAENLAKHMSVFEDDTYHEIMQFLDAAEEHGRDILSFIDQQGHPADPKRHNVAVEARQLKKIFLKIHSS
uniref:Tetratricopeptide repeat protein 30 n=3 Tax=Lotharella globosa TaxID=91324 RepID=A0A7S3YCX0_9EUKA